jgi:hypothetical protein
LLKGGAHRRGPSDTAKDTEKLRKLQVSNHWKLTGRSQLDSRGCEYTSVEITCVAALDVFGESLAERNKVKKDDNDGGFLMHPSPKC